ncbi:MAG: hypothetical protein E6Q97_08545 [Desulfurellales bacterium]|nr:MAG: hypothetical protein E6Q97_08545 [Desulfurellales bacterium]
MATFRTAEKEWVDLLAEVMKQHHPDLVEAGVTVGLLFAHAPRNDATGEPQGPALKHNGYPALAVVKINSQRDRVEGKPDATITLDGDRWPDESRESRVALLDHELAHLVLVRDEDGGIKTDDCFRPRLKCREHDFQLGGFWDVVERHGKDAVESRAYQDLHRGFSQRCFPWG